VGSLAALRPLGMINLAILPMIRRHFWDARLSSCLIRRLCGMSDHIYKKLELVGSSKKSFDDAVKNALARASKTMRNMRWFEVIETRGHIEKNKIDHWQVTIKIGFTLDR
jgi:flavin-binding protein dodecin